MSGVSRRSSISARIRKRLQQLQTPHGRAELRYGLSRHVLNPLCQPFGFVVVADHYAQPLLTDRAYRRLGPRIGRGKNLDAITGPSAARLDAMLANHIDEFHGPRGPASLGYRRDRSQLGPGDQETLFCFIRSTMPRRVLEIGAGGSTMIIAAALALNANDAEFVSVEPYPAPWMSEVMPVLSQVVNFRQVTSGLEDVGPDAVNHLAGGDVLFVDSSHVYRPGNDVECLFLDVYPSLARDVVVHVHDIFLPRDYPAWNRRDRRYWNEQYVLEAMLANSDRYETLLPLAHLADARRDVFEHHLGAEFTPQALPGSFWFRVAR